MNVPPATPLRSRVGSIRHQDGSTMHMPNEVGWSTFSRYQKRAGVGWVFIGYSEPRWGSLADATRALPEPAHEMATLYFAKPGEAWERVG